MTKRKLSEQRISFTKNKQHRSSTVQKIKLTANSQLAFSSIGIG